jgi:two-component system, cell cycle sensor histidine kinase and response regulator CckA
MNIAGGYFILGGLWIVISNELLAVRVADPELRKLVQTSKGLAFVLVSAVLLAFVLYRHLSGLEREAAARRLAEGALRMHESILEETGRIAKVGGWSFDVETGQGYWTNEVARIHELDPAAPISMQEGINYYTGESRHRIEAAVHEAIQHATPYDLELEIVTAKGVHKWIRTIGHPIVEGAKVVRVHGSFQDVTERRLMQSARERQQRRVALLADVSRRLVICDDVGPVLKGIFADIARELEVDVFAHYMVAPGNRLILESSMGLSEAQQKDFSALGFGQSLCGLVAQTGEGVVIPDLPSSPIPQAADIIALGVRAYVGLPLVSRSRLIGTISFGSRVHERFAEDDLRLLKTVADQVAAAVERGRLLDALRTGEERFREVVESILEVFWILDVEKARIIYVSPGFAIVWGRSCESLYSSMDVWRDSLHESDRARVLEATRERQNLGTYNEVYRILRPDGATRWIRDRAFPVKDASGKVIRVVGVAEDISDQRELEEKFLRAQRLEAIGTLASGIAHDLNNILSPILMSIGLLRDKLREEEDIRLLNMVEGSAQRGAGIVGQLLAFSRGLEGTRIMLHPGHILKEIAHLMGETLPKDIHVSMSVQRDLWNVVADPTQLQQVLMNLCVNARDAMPNGGSLTLSAENVHLEEGDVKHHAPAKPGPFVRLRVRDTGTGIDPAVMNRIFDPFFTTKQIGKGTGLGLSTVVGIVRNHLGLVTLHSEPGNGSEFNVFLPAKQNRTDAHKPAEPAAMPRGNAELVLFVDDEGPIRHSSRLMLEAYGYHVILASNGGEAVALFKEHRDQIRLIVTDVMMPVMGGIDMARAIRQIDSSVPIIACSGQDQLHRRAEMVEAGVVEVLDKPFDGASLLGAVSRQLKSTV